jgi:uncharacterized membrane protein
MDRKVGAALAAGFLAALQPTAALAYIGPGVGAGAIAAVVGVLGSIVLAIFAVLWYPVKRMLKNRKSKPQANKPKAG